MNKSTLLEFTREHRARKIGILNWGHLLTAFPDEDLISAWACKPFSSLLHTMYMVAPLLASSMAAILPMPEFEPLPKKPCKPRESSLDAGMPTLYLLSWSPHFSNQHSNRFDRIASKLSQTPILCILSSLFEKLFGFVWIEIRIWARLPLNSQMDFRNALICDFQTLLETLFRSINVFIKEKLDLRVIKSQEIIFYMRLKVHLTHRRTLHNFCFSANIKSRGFKRGNWISLKGQQSELVRLVSCNHMPMKECFDLLIYPTDRDKSFFDLLQTVLILWFECLTFSKRQWAQI